jgi:hypothetical protein
MCTPIQYLRGEAENCGNQEGWEVANAKRISIVKLLWEALNQFAPENTSDILQPTKACESES